MIFLVTIILSVSVLCSSYMPDGKDHECYRTCLVNDRKQCFYDFAVESYWTLSHACFDCPNNPQDCDRHDCIPADGYQRLTQVVNRKLPGPSIQVCYGDEVIVLVRNHMKSESTSIHWHGQHQKGTQFMDGVPYVTQCPINPETEFTYRFRSAQFGTHMWHSHSSVQRGNGLVGSLIIRRPAEYDNKNKLYDYDLPEHVMLLQDWTEDEANTVFIKRYHKTIDDLPRTILINGRGHYVGGVPDNTGRIPLPIFVVNKGYRYRFRIIVANYMDMPIEMTIDGHKMKVIATDGADIVPVDTDVLTFNAGERYDIVITANQPIGLYWMKFRGLIMGEDFTFQGAVLQYGTSPAGALDPKDLTYATSGSLINGYSNLNGFLNPPNNIPINQLTSLYSIPNLKPSKTVYVDFDIEEVIDDQFQLSQPSPASQNGPLPITQVPRFNNLALRLPSYPLLSQADYETEDEYCNSEQMPDQDNCDTNVCRCLHVIKIEPYTWVELILIDRGLLFDVTHPIHLHGFYFHVIGMERLGGNTTLKQVQDLNRDGKIKRNFQNPIQKDTIGVPDGGYVVVRFFADNIGFWLMHCHIDFHSDLGMALVFQVGELWNMPWPPTNFPECGNFVNQRISPLEPPLY